MDDKTYQLYDSIVSFLITDISAKTPGKNIELLGFEPNNRSHLTVFYCALYTASLAGKKVAVNLDWFNYLKLRLKHKGMKHLFYNHGDDTMGVSVHTEIDQAFRKVESAQSLNSLGAIYNTYYDPKRKDEE